MSARFVFISVAHDTLNALAYIPADLSLPGNELTVRGKVYRMLAKPAAITDMKCVCIKVPQYPQIFHILSLEFAAQLFS